jgi:hypothetical protein
VRKQALVAVSKVQAPNLDVFVGTAGNDQLAICGNVHPQDRQLVAVQRQEEFQVFGEKYLDGAVE